MEIQCWNYLDTVEVIGSIPVAPTLFLDQLHSSRFGHLLYFHTDFHTQLVLIGSFSQKEGLYAIICQATT